MSSAIGVQNVVTEIFHAQTQSGHADAFDRLSFFRDKVRFAFEGHLLGFVPRHDFLHPIGELDQLLGGQMKSLRQSI